MKAIRSFAILAVVMVFLVSTVGALPTPVISPTSPVVNQGGTINFTETASDAGTWSCAGTDSSGSPTTCAGSINSSTGVYTAPASVTNQQATGGMQLLANNHVFNTRIDGLSVNTNSGAWITELNANSIRYNGGFPLNYVDNTGTSESEVFYYTPGNNGTYQVPSYPVGQIEGGWLSARQYNPFNWDHHLLTMNTQTGQIYEFYQYYPAGTATGEGCPTCTSQSGVQYANSSYVLSPNGAPTAAGIYEWPLQIRLQEVEQAIATSGSINHAIGVTFSPGFMSNTFIWPATLSASDGGIVPFGARFRLKSAYDISGYSSTAKIFLTQLKNYGLVAVDGGTNWAVNAEATRWPKAIGDALREISIAGIAPTNFEAVDESGLEISANSGDTTRNQETVKFTRTSDSATATVDVVLQGVAVTFPKDTLYIQAGMPAQTLPVLNNIGTIAWTMSPTVGSLGATTGVYTPPATETVPTATTITATSNTNAAIAAQMTVVVMPNLPDGVIRLAPGQPSNYTDTNGKVWYSGELLIGNATVCGSSYTESCYSAGNGGSWPSVPDIQLYEDQIYSVGFDIRYDFLVPNGTYSVDAKVPNNSGSNTSQGNFVFEIQGNADASPTNVWALVGNNQPYDRTLTATVSNNKLSFVLRAVNTTGNIVATWLAAISITQTGGPPTAVGTVIAPKVSIGVKVKVQ